MFNFQTLGTARWNRPNQIIMQCWMDAKKCARRRPPACHLSYKYYKCWQVNDFECFLHTQHRPWFESQFSHLSTQLGPVRSFTNPFQTRSQCWDVFANELHQDSFWMQAKHRSQNFMMFSLLLETGPIENTAIWEKKYHKSYTVLLALQSTNCICLNSVVCRELIYNTRVNFWSLWQANPPEQKRWRNINVVIASIRRHFDVINLTQRQFKRKMLKKYCGVTQCWAHDLRIKGPTPYPLDYLNWCKKLGFTITASRV